MMKTTHIAFYQDALYDCPLLRGQVLTDIDDLRLFMEYHAFAVWDFMSLIKSLQNHIVPSGNVWLPSPESTAVGRLINEIVLCEETDDNLGGGHISHFDLYITAMNEVGANTKPILSFINKLRTNRKLSLNQLLLELPLPARKFCESTFAVIATDQPHKIAGAFAFGRERVIPSMFTQILSQMEATGIQAPKFKYYLERHIDVDGNAHGPAALDMVDYLCGDDPVKHLEAERAALDAIHARITLWKDVQRVIEDVKRVKFGAA
jgi:hypothetical protein